MRRLLAVAALLLSTSAYAGIADSPLPTLQAGATTMHLFSVPGIINDPATRTTTGFVCASTSRSPQVIGIETFDQNGGAPLNDATLTTLTLEPGQECSWTTGFPNFFSAGRDASCQSLRADLGLPNMSGSARILSTSKNLLCFAELIAFDSNSGAVAYTNLTVVYKTKQKGQ